MNEEEKKAIERIEDVFYQDLGKGINKFQKITLYEDNITDIRKLLNLIKKQQKEIDFYRNNNCILENQNGEVVAIKYCPENYISKDKIREALGIQEDVSEEKLLSLLETLMSEVDRLEDIEDKKVEVDYERVFAKGVKSVKDKLREKLEVINNEKLNYSEDEWYLENEIKGYAIDKIKEILEEE